MLKNEQGQTKTFRRVLIANRGEIAIRIIRTLRDMGIQSVAVYSEADADSLHVSMADYALCLPGTSSADTYLNIPLLLSCIRESGADAVHPGYGFLSENADFADAIAKQTQAKFIGPGEKAIRVMGDKVSAKKLLRAHQIPLVPGSHGPLQDYLEFEEMAREFGFPLILKASAGGGGRGIRIVHEASEMRAAFEACQREAQSYFGNPALFCERFIQDPRHIEVQVLFDEWGHGVHLFERDCSLQRRQQKIFEEAPSLYLDETKRQRLGELAVKIASLVDYSGVGTVEFICESPEKIYFMEMNTRIQVEHPVTEMITGLDLIEEQIRVASGQRLRWAQKEIHRKGWCLEARINAEDPLLDFAPSPGRVTHLRLPSGPHVRVDSHLYSGYAIPSFYDSMLAKVIVWGSDRDEAVRRLRRALREFELGGLACTVKFHEALLSHPDFLEGNFSTGFLENKKQELLSLMKSSPVESLKSEGMDTEEDLLAALSAVILMQSFENESSNGMNKPVLWGKKARMESTTQ